MSAPSSPLPTAQLGVPGAPAISVQHLWQRLGRHDAVRDVSFEVPRGSVFGFIGPNGAGKTTTIRVLTTLTPPTAGRVEICGVDVTRDPQTVRKLIGYMPDHAGTYPRLTTRQYLVFFADVCGIPVEGIDQVVQAVMELTGLVPLEDKFVTAMSKGMRQRLQLARILLSDPQVLILDEPASDLDPRARIEMRDLLLDLARMGKTIFLSSHILTELADMCSAVAIVEQGMLKAAGPINQIAAMLATGQSAPSAALAASRGVRLRVLAPPDAAYHIASSLPGVSHASAEPHGDHTVLQLAYAGDDRALAQLVTQLVQHGLGVFAVEPDRGALERIFMQLTHGELR